jgi:glycosyltransferase involved in cell wall biosynthesis
MSQQIGECPKVVVLCPVRNEAWILPMFLTVVSQFADHIIIADQGSTDGSREICKMFDKVILVNNPSQTRDEGGTRKLLVDESRKIPGRRLLFALDADEIPSSNILNSPEWQTALKAEPGTAVGAHKVQLWKTPLCYKSKSPGSYSEYHNPLICIDDGKEYEGEYFIHGPRLPFRKNQRVVLLNEIVVMHYQTAAWSRGLSRNRWYRCIERVKQPSWNPTKLHRFYLQYLDGFKSFSMLPCPETWHSGWRSLGIDTTSVQTDKYYWWDWEVLRLFGQYGEHTFRHEDIWVNWEEIRQAGIELGIPGLPQRSIRDPRTKLEHYLTAICRRTQGTRWQRPADVFLGMMGR